MASTAPKSAYLILSSVTANPSASGNTFTGTNGSGNTGGVVVTTTITGNTNFSRSSNTSASYAFGNPFAAGSARTTYTSIVAGGQTTLTVTVYGAGSAIATPTPIGAVGQNPATSTIFGGGSSTTTTVNAVGGAQAISTAEITGC